GRDRLRAVAESAIRRPVGRRPEPAQRRPLRHRRQLPPRDHAAARAGSAGDRWRVDRRRRAAGAIRPAGRKNGKGRPMTRDGERVIELVNELGSRVSHVLTDMVPPAAQVHLLNAQRELITALMLIYENRVAPAPQTTRARRAKARRRTTRRDSKIPIE